MVEPQFKNDRPLVYVAGPLTTLEEGQTVQDHINTAFSAGCKLVKAGYAPFVPHWSGALDESYESDYETWMDVDFTFVIRCNFLVRLPGRSGGGDREVKFAKSRFIPVVTLETLLGIEANKSVDFLYGKTMEMCDAYNCFNDGSRDHKENCYWATMNILDLKGVKV